MDALDGFMSGVVLTAIIGVIAFLLIHEVTDQDWKKQIANHGAAHFYIDANNDRQWDWIPCGPTVEVK